MDVQATATRLGPFKFALVSSCCMLGLLFFGFMLGYTCRKYRKYEATSPRNDSHAGLGSTRDYVPRGCMS